MINPFESPRADLDDRAPQPEGEEQKKLEDRRRRGMRRETTLRALGVMKLATAVFFGAAGIWCAGRPNELLSPSDFLLAGFFFSFSHLGIGLGLMTLRPWACWLQSISSGVATLFAMGLLSAGLSEMGQPETLVATSLFSGTLLLAVHGVLIYLVLSTQAARVTSREYARAIEATQDWPIAKIVAFKVALLATLWLADLAALAIRMVATP